MNRKYIEKLYDGGIMIGDEPYGPDINSVSSECIEIWHGDILIKEIQL